MKNIAFVESVTDESGTDHRVRACINGVVLRGEWTSVEERATKQAASIRAMLAAAPSIPDAEGQVRQGLSEAEIECGLCDNRHTREAVAACPHGEFCGAGKGKS